MWIIMLDLHTAVILTSVKSSVMDSLTIRLLLLSIMHVTCYADDTQLYVSAKQNNGETFETIHRDMKLTDDVTAMLNSIQTKHKLL